VLKKEKKSKEMNECFCLSQNCAAPTLCFIQLKLNYFIEKLGGRGERERERRERERERERKREMRERER